MSRALPASLDAERHTLISQLAVLVDREMQEEGFDLSESWTRPSDVLDIAFCNKNAWPLICALDWDVEGGDTDNDPAELIFAQIGH